MTSFPLIGTFTYDREKARLNELVVTVGETADPGEIGFLRLGIENVLATIPLDDRRAVLNHTLETVWANGKGMQTLNAFYSNFHIESLIKA